MWPQPLVSTCRISLLLCRRIHPSTTRRSLEKKYIIAELGTKSAVTALHIMNCSGAVRVEHFMLRPLVAALHFCLLLNTRYAELFLRQTANGEKKTLGECDVHTVTRPLERHQASSKPPSVCSILCDCLEAGQALLLLCCYLVYAVKVVKMR